MEKSLNFISRFMNISLAAGIVVSACLLTIHVFIHPFSFIYIVVVFLVKHLLCHVPNSGISGGRKRAVFWGLPNLNRFGPLPLTSALNPTAMKSLTVALFWECAWFSLPTRMQFTIIEVKGWSLKSFTMIYTSDVLIRCLLNK